MKVIRYLENRIILLKETTRKIISQQGCFHNFLRILITAGLSIMNSKMRRGVTTATKKYRRRAELLMPPHHLTNFEIKNIFQTNLNLMVFIKEIIYLK